MNKNIISDVTKQVQRLKPETIVVGDRQKLSRRKARKLAHLYRGSRRGLWYKSYLAGDTKYFLVVNGRLVRNWLTNLRVGQGVFETYHCIDAKKMKRIGEKMSAMLEFDIGGPMEFKIRANERQRRLL